MKQLDIIGRAEFIELVDFDLSKLPAKIDTGADSSSIWVSEIDIQADGLYGVLFGPGSPYHTGAYVRLSPTYTVTRVANSFGQKELRYKLKLRIRVQGHLIKATFTLSDRSAKTYPILLGRRLLKDKFIVDVTKGSPLKKLEKVKAQRLEADLKALSEGGGAV